MKIVRTIANILFILLIIILVYFLVNFKMYIVASGSMQPDIQQNELIIVENQKNNTTYQIGDIITYYNPHTSDYVTHRVVEKLDDGYYTKGDYNNTKDLEVVHKENIIGKVVYHSLEAGFLYINYRFVMLGLVIAFIVAIGILLNIGKKEESEEVSNERK